MPDPRGERAFNAPWPALAIGVALLGLYAVQSQTGGESVWAARFGLRPEDLSGGSPLRLLTYMGAHDGWLHAGMNALGALTFGAPVARRLGTGRGGAAGLLLLFLVCGVVAGAGYALLAAAQGQAVVVIGASGAVFGLIGGATRLANVEGRLMPLLSRPVLSMAAAWIGVNVLIGVLGFDPASGVRSVAWEAHIIGMLAGLILIGPFVRVFGSATAASAVESHRADSPSSGPWGGRG